MIRLALLLAALLLPAAAGAETDALAALEARQQALFASVAPSVVYLGNGSSFGSGFFVSDDGLILTNAHVIGESEEMDVVLHDGRKLRGKVVERATEEIDLALVKVEVRSVALPLGGAVVRVGSWVASVGHGMGGVWTFTTGMVSNIYPHDGDRPVFQTQIPLNPGNSGGPIVDRAGRAVGIVTSGITESNSINFAIRSEVAIRALEGLQGNCECLLISAPAGIPVLVDGKMVGKGPRVVLPAVARSYRVQAVIGGKMKQVEAIWPATRAVALE